ncbi:formylglycine-generating enzyme family protein [Hyalangium rubrum]|uniref:SUMF1/EgtB/PvdO family nonheme iron enzyme n=1 Tax=Hyalangium rubrum TaxID=3103134 RepID=A0ABU5H3X3_9BACT|nr:SUMF1/EgtB/PvdO family nonheme iron enzyme [Hyalangium sp. s54d21]MDY7228154.1 SUMF1/EgtB/PvdO family nonheme iron enzyme [Hyalangium sp. s54d21]
MSSLHFQLMPIPAGEFQMGSTAVEVDRAVERWQDHLIDPDYKPVFRRWLEKESPAHRVAVEAFHLARFPVTNGQYRAFVEHTGHAPSRSLRERLPDDHPVWGLSGADIEAFLSWARDLTGMALRLPTEAEWEYAARGPKHLEYPFGNEFDSQRCNTHESGLGTTTSVFRYADYPSPFGVCDMAGNVEEWTASPYAPYPGGDFIQDNLTEALGQQYAVLRGGSAECGGDLTRCARRHGPHPRFELIGFRLAF